MADGWYHGEKLLDGEQGWFPANHTKEVASEHVRARNLKQRHRLLALSSSVIQQRRAKQNQGIHWRDETPTVHLDVVIVNKLLTAYLYTYVMIPTLPQYFIVDCEKLCANIYK